MLNQLTADLKSVLFDFIRYDIAAKILLNYLKDNEWNKVYAQQLKQLLDSKALTEDDIIEWWFKSGVVSEYVHNEKIVDMMKKWIVAYVSGKEELNNEKKLKHELGY